MPPKKAASKKKTAAKKKAAPKKTTAAKKKTAGKTPAKKRAARKKTATKTNPPTTTITAKVDVGFGNRLFLRGEGADLSWENGTLMECVDDDTWVWTTDQASAGIVFKFCLNDENWSLGDDLTVAAGGQVSVSPRF